MARAVPKLTSFALAAALASLAALALCATPAAALYDGDASFYLHRDGSLTLEPPISATPAAVGFGLLGAAAATFQTPPLDDSLAFRGPGVLRVTLATTISVLGRVEGALDVDGVPVASSTSEELVVLDLRLRDVELLFSDLNGTVPAGGQLGLTVRVIPLLVLDLGILVVPVLDVIVEMRYDSTDAPSALHLLGVETGADGGPGGPGGGPGSGGGGTGGGTGGDGNGGVAPTGGNLPLLGPANVDPVVALAGAATSVVAVGAGLALRGRW